MIRTTAAFAFLLGVAQLSCDQRLPSDAAIRSAGNRCFPSSGTWVIASPQGFPVGRILLIQVDSDSTSPSGAASIVELPAPSAEGTTGHLLLPSSIADRSGCSSLDFYASMASSGAEVRFHAQILGDTAQGFVSSLNQLVEGVRFEAFGLRVDPALVMSSVATEMPGTAAADSTPILMLRVDDASAADRDFLPRLAVRGLRAELAVPTALVDEPGRLTWSEISSWVRLGFGVAAHSRHHSDSTNAEYQFMAEVVGSLADLRNRAMPSRVFVQPGVWRDSIDFDTAAKLANWRGALMRLLTNVFEANASPADVPTGMVTSVPLGVGHFTVSDEATAGWVMTQWHRLFVPGSFTVFLVHSVNVQPVDKLDWLLDSIAAAVAGGRLRLASAADALNQYQLSPPIVANAQMRRQGSVGLRRAAKE